MLLAQSTTKDYIRAEHKLYCNSKLNIISQVIILPQVMFFGFVLFLVVVVVVLPIYIPRALNTGICLRQDDLFYSARSTQEP